MRPVREGRQSDGTFDGRSSLQGGENKSANGRIGGHFKAILMPSQKWGEKMSILTNETRILVTLESGVGVEPGSMLDRASSILPPTCQTCAGAGK